MTLQKITPRWILWVIPPNQRHLSSTQRAQYKLFAVHMKVLLHGIGLCLAPTWGFGESLALPLGSWSYQGLWRGHEGSPSRSCFQKSVFSSFHKVSSWVYVFYSQILAKCTVKLGPFSPSRWHTSKGFIAGSPTSALPFLYWNVIQWATEPRGYLMYYFFLNGFSSQRSYLPGHFSVRPI